MTVYSYESLLFVYSIKSYEDYDDDILLEVLKVFIIYFTVIGYAFIILSSSYINLVLSLLLIKPSKLISSSYLLSSTYVHLV